MRSIVWDLGRKSDYPLEIPLRALPKVGFDYENDTPCHFSPLRMTCSALFRFKANKKAFSCERRGTTVVVDE